MDIRKIWLELTLVLVAAVALLALVVIPVLAAYWVLFALAAVGVTSPKLIKMSWCAFKGVSEYIDDKRMQNEQLLLMASVRERVLLGDDTEYDNALTGIKFKINVPVRTVVEEVEEDDDEVLQIGGPKSYTLSQQLQSGETSEGEATSIIGYMDGEPFRAKIFDVQGNLFNSVFVFGDQGFGKSTFGTYLAALTILQGGKLIVIDPESEADQSLTTRLGPLAQESFLLCPIADTPEKAERAVHLARQIIEQYGNHKLLVLIDEFTLIARQAFNGRGPWSEVGKEILDVSEEYATRGRKKGCRAICFGQIPKAERSGGTEVRDSMATVCFNLKKDRAQRILEADDAAQAPSLKIGEIILAPSSTTYRLQLPFPDKDGLEQVALIGRSLRPHSEPLYDNSQMSSIPFSDEFVDGEFVDVEPDMGEAKKPLDEPVEPVEESPVIRPYAMMSDLQATQFVALYPLIGIEKALDRIEGCSHRHRAHARQIIRERNLKRKEA